MIDFENDLKLLIHDEYGYLGIKIPLTNNLNDMLLKYMTIHTKIVQPIPREVRINPELEKILDTHEKGKIVKTIISRLKIGKDVNQFQSKRLLQSNFHDHLLNEWHIYHFHLNDIINPKTRKLKGTKSLLFTYIDDKQAILLGIDTHRHGVFADDKWLRILDMHFPEILEPYIAKDIVDINPSLSPQDRQTLWEKGCTIGLTMVNSKVIFSPGIGRSTSGHSMIVGKTVNEIIRWIHRISNQFSNNYLAICEALNVSSSVAKFRVSFDNTKLVIIEQKSQQIVLIFPQIFNFKE